MQRRREMQRFRCVLHGSVYFVLFVLAVLPRTVGLDDFLTYDEAYHWIGRTERFFYALLEGDLAGTRQTGHPGVTAMWLGSLGLYFERLLVVGGSSVSQMEHVAWMRLPSGILHGVFVAASFFVLRRLVAPLTALIAALLWATSPFLIAHARLLHLDALLTDFVSFSYLCMLVAVKPTYSSLELQDSSQYHSVPAKNRQFPSISLGNGLMKKEHATSPQRTRRTQRIHTKRVWLVASGVFAGLALLTKGPSLILLPWVGIMLFWQIEADGLFARVSSSIVHYLAWLGVALLVVVVLWPALWVIPELALGRYIQKILWEGSNPYVKAQFFFGQAVSDPGPLFYPIVSLFRMTPIALVGLVGLCVAFGRRLLRVSKYRHYEWSTLVVLGAFILFWGLVMTSGSKKFDRYVLPVWPSLLIVSAAGLASIVYAIEGWMKRYGMRVVLLLVFLGVSVQPVLAYYPHYLSYYNSLLGGGAVAQNMLLIGWGEGMECVGAYLRERPDVGYGPILAADTRLLEPFVPVPVKHLDELDEGTQNYAVLDLPSMQRGLYAETVATIQQRVSMPIHRVTIHGITYAWVYQLPKPYEKAMGVQFGDWLYLHGVTIVQAPGSIVVTPSWGVFGVPPADYWVFLHVMDAEGEVVAQSDVALGGADMPVTRDWQPGQQVSVPLPLIMPSEIPHGTYRVVMGVYDSVTGERLLVQAGHDMMHGGDTLVLDTILWRP